MVDDGCSYPADLNELKHAPRGMDSADSVLDVEQHNDRVDSLDGSDLGIRLCPVDLDGKAGGTLQRLRWQQSL